MQSGILLLLLLILLLLLCALPELVFFLLPFLVFILTACSIPGACSFMTLTIFLTSWLCFLALASAGGGDLVDKSLSVAGNFWGKAGIAWDMAENILDVTGNLWDELGNGLSWESGKPRDEDTKITTRFTVTSMFGRPQLRSK